MSVKTCLDMATHYTFLEEDTNLDRVAFGEGKQMSGEQDWKRNFSLPFYIFQILYYANNLSKK